MILRLLYEKSCESGIIMSLIWIEVDYAKQRDKVYLL